MGKFKKVTFVILSSVILFVTIVIVLISPIVKYLIEKYDVQLTGRQITLDWAFVNPFNGYIHLDNLEIHEYNSDSVFFSARGISANLSLLKLIKQTYEIDKLVLNEPRGVIIQRKDYFNFNDLIRKFSPNETVTVYQPVHFNVLNIQIFDGQFRYIDELTPVNYAIKNFNLTIPGVRWDVDSIVSHFSFTQSVGTGDINGDLMLNLKNRDYRLAVIVKRLDLNIFQQYLRNLTNYGSFSAILDADMKTTGNLDVVSHLTSSGYLNLSSFHFGKSPKEDYLSFDKLTLAIEEMSPQNKIFSFDSISLWRPYFKYEKYDNLDNIQTMFGKGGSNIDSVKANEFNLILEIADYIKEITKNFFQSDYKISKLGIYNADIKFNDYSLSEKFGVDLNPLTILSDSIDKKKNRINVYLKSGIKPFGNMMIGLSINPQDSSDFDLHYHIGKLPAPMFNPYIISQTSFPLDRGTIELNGSWNVRNGIIFSKNHLLIIDPRLAKRLKNDDLNWFPMRPVMTLVRERGNVIDYEVPISGNLQDPKFKFKDVILDIIDNIFVKPVSTSYIVQVKNTEKLIEKNLSLTWRMHNSILVNEEKKFLKTIAKFLKQNPAVTINVFPNNYAIKEKEYILLFEAKKKYYVSIHKIKNNLFNPSDSIAVERLSIKDPDFVKYLDLMVKDSLLFTTQEKSARLIDKSVVNKNYLQLNLDRDAKFLEYFKEEKVNNQVVMNKPADLISYNGFSFFEIKYIGEFPDELIEAYQKFDQFNNKAPRKKFKQKRETIQKNLKE